MATATQLMPAANPSRPYPDEPGPAFAPSTSCSDSLLSPPEPYPAVEPSPVDSNGTNTTDIDDDAQDARSPPLDHHDALTDMDDVASPAASPRLPQLDTTLRARSNSSDDAPQSVIHAPRGFHQFSPPSAQSPADTEDSANTVVSPATPDAVTADEKRESAEAPHAIDTSVPGKSDRTTPRAQTRQEADEEWKWRNRASKSLEDIAETEDTDKQVDEDAESSIAESSIADSSIAESSVDESSIDESSVAESLDETEIAQAQTMGQALENLNHAEQEVKALKMALSECWTLCNTLAGLSSIHRERMFNFSGQGEQGEQAWKSCWRLCQKLYESREEDQANEVKPTLELCRDFCQALFEARHRNDEASDSVLRVSFELNNHLYNTADRNLPEAFRERTLDFYITLCHRLMKQRTSLPQETDSLLRACWSLAEMLFSLRQNTRDGKPADEELLGSAVQACWELCDLFREGWTQVRPDRGTPRPSQSTFPVMAYNAQSQRGRSVAPSERSSSLDDSYHSAKSLPPETPTTIFDDMAEMSPDEPNVPNILVLGPETSTTRTHNRWSSSASTLSGFSESSQRSSSTATAGREDPHLVRLKTLILKAAMNAGYNRTMSSSMMLPAFVKSLPSNSFGSQPWQTDLLLSYKKLVLADPTLRVPAAQLPARRLGAAEVARAVQWMSRAEQFSWFGDLYRLVFGFYPEEGAQRANVVIQT